MRPRRSWKKSNKKKEKAAQEESNDACATDTEDSNSVESGAESSANRKQKLCYNFVAEDIEGIILRRTKCLECECVTERKEPFYDIQMESLNADELYRRACVTSEKLCDTNKYLCETCRSKNCLI